MHKAWLVTGIVLVVVFGAIFGTRLYADHRAASAPHGQPPVAVATAVAGAATWAPRSNVVGSLEAVQGTEITAQIAGNVTEIAFQSGARAQRGQLLVRLDDSSQLAQLHADEAKLQLAQTTLERTQKLYAAKASSLSDLQTAQADAGIARAAVEGDRATLAKLHISAPFAGTVGIREVSLGQYVSPGTPIVDLQSWDPLLLDFSVPQSQLPQLAPGSQVSFSADAFPDAHFTGKITAVGSRVDPATRNVALQATLANPGGRLRPGLYGHVQLALGTAQHGIVVPHTAIAYSTFGDSVYVVADGAQGKVAHAQVVQVSEERDGQALLGSGIKTGDVVVIAGQNKLRDGVPVTIDNTIKP